jgi:hypothetical protein
VSPGRDPTGRAGDVAPAYVLAVCEGGECVAIVPVPGVPRATAVGPLAELAALLRARGAIGRLVLLDARTGAVVASRRVRP